MNSSMIGKIEKAHRYAQEPHRVQLQTVSATFHGGHDDYTIALENEAWHCNCHTFESHVIGTCSHVMAMQLLLGQMLSEDARFSVEPTATAVNNGDGGLLEEVTTS